MSDILVFQYNAASSFAYMLTSNLWFFLLVVGVAGTIFLLLKEEIDTSVREEQNIIQKGERVCQEKKRRLHINRT